MHVARARRTVATVSIAPHPHDAPPPARTDDTAGRTVADVMHAGVEALPATATVGELRAWFAISPSRRLAVLASDGRYRASLTPDDVPPEEPADRPALALARHRPTLAPETAAVTGRELVFATSARRVAVVGADGHLHGVLAVTTDLGFFACRPAPPAPRARD